MKIGYYKKNPTDFRKYRVSRFSPHLYDMMVRPYDTCGTAVLSTITGESPIKVEKHLPRGQRHWTDTALTNYLKQKGYIVKKVTKCDVTGDPTFVQYPITDQHVVITTKLVCKNEGTWTLTYNGAEYHNFEVYKMNPLEYLNNPIMSAYVVYHRKWK